ncbi:metallophosphoesterase family protein [Fulvimarina endophytica]|nr:metallophosphoesterase family protein [Fulvimarina endophytica]
MPVPEISARGPVLVFGGPYGNLQATRAVLEEARALGLSPDHILCTGDVIAYCAEPAETVDLIRAAGIRVVAGNCEEQIAGDADDCGCGFGEGSACDALSAAWYPFAKARIDADAKRWMAELPRRIDLVFEIGGGRTLRLAAVHAAPSSINRFLFASSPEAEIAMTNADGVVAGHCGLPFTRMAGGRLWHNAGVVGMPANDGTPRVWFSLMTPEDGGLRIEHRALAYDHEAAASAMAAARLPAGYREALSSGLWPNMDILPKREREARGQPIAETGIVWTPVRDDGSPGLVMSANGREDRGLSVSP